MFYIIILVPIFITLALAIAKMNSKIDCDWIAVFFPIILPVGCILLTLLLLMLTLLIYMVMYL